MNYRYGGEDAELLEYLEERIEKDPTSAFFGMVSHYYLDNGKIAEALSIAQRGVIAHPNYSTGHIILAMAMIKARLFYDARKELTRANDLKPGSKIVETLTETLDKEEQADEIGRKLAEQFRKNRAGGKDLMKTIEETIEAYRPKAGGDDFIIPGLDSIMRGEPGKIAPKFKPPTLMPSQEEISAKYDGSSKAPSHDAAGAGSSIAKEIIQRVTREFESRPTESSESSKEPVGKETEDTDLHPQNESASAKTESLPASSLRTPPNETEPLFEPDEVEPGAGDLDLDSLARELETAGPIRPRDGQPRERSDESGIELTPEIVTETLAKIFEQQGQLKTAIEAYNILIKKKPEQAETYRKKIAELTQRTNG